MLVSFIEVQDWLPYLPRVAAPPAGFSGDAQRPAARLVGYEGELPHRTASEAVQCVGESCTHRGRSSDQEEEEERRMHAG